MLPETTVVPNLQARAVFLPLGQSPVSTSPQHRHRQNRASGFVDNLPSSGRKHARRTAGSCVTTDPNRLSGSDYPATSTSIRSPENSPRTVQPRGKRHPRRYTHGLAAALLIVAARRSLPALHRVKRPFGNLSDLASPATSRHVDSPTVSIVDPVRDAASRCVLRSFKSADDRSLPGATASATRRSPRRKPRPQRWRRTFRSGRRTQRSRG